MNIGLLSFEYPPETGFGGIGTYTWYHARALARLGHKVHVLAGSAGAADLRTEEREGVLVHRFRARGLLMRAFHGLGRWHCYWTRQRLENAWSMYHALKTLMRHHRFDVLEMPECGAEGGLIASRIEIPTVVRLHSPSRLIMGFYDVPDADITMCSWVERRALERATALTSCSAFLGEQVRDVMGIRAPIRVIPNGIDLGLFDAAPVADLSRFGVPKGKVTIFFGARMERRKGIHLCGEIAASILTRYDAAFVFAGQDLFGYMQNELLPSLSGKTLRGSVHYLGKLDLDETRSWMRTADIVMLPSLWENCPYSCLEAMAARRAIVSSDQGGMPELIVNGANGLLARSGDPQAFVEQLETLIESAALRKRLGDAARRSVEAGYTDDHIARRTEDVYRECVYGRGLAEGVPA